MTTVLRPMSTGEVLDRMIHLYRNNFVLFFGIATVPPALWLLMQVVLYAIGRGTQPNESAGSTLAMVAVAAGFLVTLAAYFVGAAVAQAATVFAVSAVHLERPTTIRECYRRVRGRYGRVFNVVFSVSLRVFGGGLLIVLALVMVPIAMTSPATGAPNPLIAGLLVFAAIIAAAVIVILLLVRYALAVPACVLEDIKARAAIKRGVVLSKGSRGRIFVVYLLFGVLEVVFAMGLGMVIGLTAPPFLVRNPALQAVVSNLLGFLIGALLGPIVTIGPALIYYDQRVRKEAFDIQLMMATLDGPQPATAAGAPAGTIG